MAIRDGDTAVDTLFQRVLNFSAFKAIGDFVQENDYES
jgi:hypothetical protein